MNIELFSLVIFFVESYSENKMYKMYFFFHFSVQNGENADKKQEFNVLRDYREKFSITVVLLTEFSFE